MSRTRKLLLFLSSLAVLAASIAAPAVASSLIEPDVIQPQSSAANDAPYWVAYGSTEFGETWICTKDDVGADANYVVPAPPDGYLWRLIVVKQATNDYLFFDPPTAGVLNSGGARSHVISCRMEIPTGAVLVNKIDATGAPLAGAGFTLTPGDIAMTEIQPGVFCTEDLEVGSSYTATETTVPAGYTPGAPVLLTPVVGTNCSTSLPSGGAVGTVTNTPAPGDVYIEKVDVDGAPMAGVVFTLTGTGYLETRTTDAAGEASFLDVPLGTYTLSETIPNGYVLGEVSLDSVLLPAGLPHTFDIGLGSAPATGQTFTFEVENVPVPGDVYIEKVDGIGEPLAGVVFTLTGTGYLETCTTDAAGDCGFLDVPLGTYTLSETYPIGYVGGSVTLNGIPLPAGLPHTFDIGLGSAPATGQTFTFEVVNEFGDEWCSPGFWRNSLIAAAEAAEAGGFSLDDPYTDFFAPITGLNTRQLLRSGLPTSPSLLQVLQNPQVYGGEAFNNVGDLLSDAHPDVNFAWDFRVENSCPLPADASRS
jgi:uncharacterized surface anchored protein